MDSFLAALLHIIQPSNLIAVFGGALLGMLSGATPGVSGTMMVVLLIPLTYTLEPDTAFLLLISVYCSSVFSGSISAILFRTPGAPEAVATTLDGYELTKQGKPHEALGISVYSSAVGGLLGGAALILVAPQLAKIALAFGPPEYFGMAIMGLSVVTTLGAKNMVKAFLAALLGLFLATVGIDPMAGIPRFTFGLPSLMSGIDFIPVLIGLFAISEILRQVMEDTTVKVKLGKIRTSLPSFTLQKRLMPTIFGGSALGTVIGILPGIGATTAAMVSYSEAVRWSKTPEKFGTGHPEGIAAPESSNNAAANGAMVPLLALGIPGSATTAVMLGAFILHGLKPGPLLFTEQAEFINTIFLGRMIANAIILLVAPIFIRGFANIIRIPYPVLGPVILVLCIVGSYAIRNNMMDVWLTLGFGVLGYVLEKYGFPLSPIILGIVLGGLAEQEFRRSLIMSQGDYAIFFNSPIAAVLLGVSCLSFIAPIAINFYKKRKANAASTGA